jgi:hypothetical protein
VLGTGESPLIPARDSAEARLSLEHPNAIEAGHCMPLWATIDPPSYGSLKLDTYGIVARQPQSVYRLACSPKLAVVDDFHYDDSPLGHGWIVSPDAIGAGELATVRSQELGRHVLQLSTPPGGNFAARKNLRAYGRPLLLLQIKTSKSFSVYAGVRDEKGDSYYVQYMPTPWPAYPNEYPKGIYVFYVVGGYFMDGGWHKLERDVYQDFATRTGKKVAYIESLVLRTEGSLQIAEPTLSVED